jgi:hypothetical protein
MKYPRNIQGVSFLHPVDSARTVEVVSNRLANWKVVRHGLLASIACALPNVSLALGTQQ